MRPILLVALLPLLGATSCQARPVRADLVLTGGRLVTVDPQRPQVAALAARGERIIALGSAAEIAAWIGPETQVIDLAGRLAVPGFIESHGHFMGLGLARLRLDLRAARTWDELLATVADAVESGVAGELIEGRGWHQEKWSAPPPNAVAGMPHHATLSAVSPEHPLILTHASGHAALANARAMALAGIDRSTPDPPGGEIVRDAEGVPTGVFLESAMDLLAAATEGAREPDQRRVALLAAEECLSKGITTFQDAGAPLDTVVVYRLLAEAGELGVRLWVMLSDPNERLAEALGGLARCTPGAPHVRVGGIKRVMDGALGSRGAWLLEPYADSPESTGLNTTPLIELEETARLALAHDLQLCVHAIGDRANRETLDLFERAFETVQDGPERRWRVEHAQHLHPDDVPRFAQLGVVAAMQGVHCTSDGAWVPARIGAQRSRSGAYLWRTLLDSGVVISNGTDCPVEDIDPLRCFQASVTRRLADGSVFYPAQCMTRREALSSYTLDAARAAFEEQDKGSLAVGKLCDVAVLSLDILTCPDDALDRARVDMTIVGGELLYRRP
ncbi:MAG TPA: amidohydrolase [Planctomycetota bacterium]|nr:amidohydrolase [Planctomycetota bacterium]